MPDPRICKSAQALHDAFCESDEDFDNCPHTPGHFADAETVLRAAGVITGEG